MILVITVTIRGMISQTIYFYHLFFIVSSGSWQGVLQVGLDENDPQNAWFKVPKKACPIK